MIEDGLRTLAAWLCNFVYSVIAWVYELFINISRVELLSSEDIKPIYERVTMILAIIMVFYITFEFVKFVVQPDGIVDKEKGAQKTVMKMIIVVVLIAFVPNIFNWAYKLQNTIFENQLFSKIILGKQDVEMSSFGRDFSANVLSMFYYVDEGIEWDSATKGEKCGELECKQVVSLNMDYLRQNGKLPYLTMGLDEKAKAVEEKTGEKVEEYKIYFNGLFAIGVGAFVAYMLILYCVDAGIRVAQLTFLQIIAPIPIIGYLSPKKDGIFQKWVKQCVTTYLDLFLRVGIIYFVLLICQILGEAFTDGTILENATNVSQTMKVFMFIAILMGLLLFAKKAPKMLQELFPSSGAASGNFGLKPGERVPAMAARAIGAGLGGVNAMVRKGIAQGQATRKRNAQIKDRLRAEGKDTSRAAVRQARREADLNARLAKKTERQTRRDYDKQQRDTRSERKAVLEAQRELAAAERSGDKAKKEAAQKKLARAQDAYNVKKASLAAGSDGGKVADAQMYSSRKQAMDSAKGELDKAKKDVADIEKKRKDKADAVLKAETALAEAKKGNDQNAIKQAQANLDSALQARDGGKTIYDQEQIIAKNKADIGALEGSIKQNEEILATEQGKYNNTQAATVAAKNKLDTVNAQAQKEEDLANQVLQDAIKTNDKQQIKVAQEGLAKVKYDNAMAIGRAEKEYQAAQTQEKKAEQNFKQIEDNINQANDGYRSQIQSKEQQNQAASTLREQEIAKRDASYTKAQQEREQKQNIFDQKEQEFSPSRQVIADYSDKFQKDYEKAKEDRVQKEDIQFDQAQNSYRAPAVLSGLAGAATGLKTGIKTGWEAQKLEDIRKKVDETTKQVKQEVVQHEKWLDSGGTSTTQRYVSKVQQDLGFSTNAQRMEHEVKVIEAEVKTLESANSVESSIIQSADKVKDNNVKKMQQGKLKTKIAGLKPHTYGNSTFTFIDGETVSEAYARAKSDVDVAEQRLKTATENGDSSQIIAAQKELGEKRQIAEQVTSKLHEESFDQILKAIAEYKKGPSKTDPRTNPEFDAGSVQSAYETLWNIENARNNQNTVQSMSKLLTPEEFEAFMGRRDIDNFDTYDAIEKQLKRSTGERLEKINNKKQQQQGLSGSAAYAAHKADDSTVNSGK